MPRFAIATFCLALASFVHAGDSTTTSGSTALNSTRFGPLNMLDHRSAYGQGVFPEPFLIDDSDLERGEFRVDWLHTKAGSSHSDSGKIELEKGFGLVTLELELPYERNVSPDGVTRGVGNVSVGARVPVFQYVSQGGFFDSTTGVGLEVGIPTTSVVSKNTEIVPKIFNDLRLGSHVTLQTVLGYSALFGPGEDSGTHFFEYSGMLGYTIQHQELPIPGIRQLIPFFELKGEKQLNKADKGANTLLGDLGLRINLKAIGPVQPRIGAGWVFPLNQTTRDDVHSGVIVSMVFDF